MLTRSLTLAAALAGLVGSAALTAVRSARQTIPWVSKTAACTTAWSTPTAIMVGKGYVHVDAPQIVATRAGTALLGDNAFAAASTDSGFTPLAGWPRGEGMIAGILLRPNGDVVPIPAPPGVRAFIEVRAASHAGVAHVFWGGSADTSSMQSQHVNSLWYARYDGTAWTRPELVLADSTLRWVHQLTWVTMAKGRAHLMTLVGGAMLADDVLHVVRDAHGRGSVARPGFQALYTNLAVDPDGTLWLATITGGGADRALVLIRRSANDGRSWSGPVEVYRSGLGTAYDPRLVVTPDGTLYAAWIVEPPGDVTGHADRIAVSVSTDRGATWRSLPAITAPPAVRDLWSLLDGSSALQVTFHTDAAGGSVVATRMDRGRWGPWSTFGPTWFAAMLAVPTRDTLYLAWHELRAGGPERMPTLMVSRRRSCLE